MFLHGDLFHLLFNMLALFMFGCAVERTWGTKLFVRYYLLCGLGAALLAFIPYGPFYSIPIVGASGAIYGILLAYAVLFPRNQIWVLMTFPVEARYLVVVWGFIAFVSSLMGADGRRPRRAPRGPADGTGAGPLDGVPAELGAGSRRDYGLAARDVPAVADETPPEEVRGLLREALRGRQ